MERAPVTVNRPIPAPAVAAAAHVQCQSLSVSSPTDAAEAEARRVARQVVTMPAHQASARPGALQPPATATSPVAASAAGEALPESVRQEMEPRFGADFSRVRIHRDERAATASRQLNAAAFTVGQHIHFGQGQWQPGSAAGRELIAHELTHTIQQGAANHIHRSELPAITVSSPPAVQRLGIGDAWDYFARAAEAIPGFRLLSLALGRNPVTQQAVDRTPSNLLRAAIELIPGGALITRALDNHGIIERVAAWVAQQVSSVGQIAAGIRQSIDRFLGSLSWSDIFDLGGVWERARQIVTVPIARITAFVSSLASGILQLIRDAILRPLAGLAQGTRGWDLLCAVLGRNPITGEPVPRTAANLIGGFMRLIGQEEVWQNLQRANAVNRAFAWFQGTLAGVAAFVTNLPGVFMSTLRSLTINDLLTLPQTFGRVAGVFANFVGSFISWAGQQVWTLLEIIFDVVAPAVMPYLRRAAAAFRTIIANPVHFVGNLVRAAVMGFRQFAANIVNHLRAALVGWLTGTLAGANIYIPQSFSLQEIIKFVLSVLGLTWQNIRSKLVRVVGETAVTAMETGFDIVVTLVRDGPAAAWERIRESLSNLREMVMEQIMAFVRNNIVTAAVTRLVSMLNPAGAFIQAIIATYNTIMFFVERLRQIAQVAAAFIDSIAAIANGVLTAAANRVEQTMAGLLTLVISFLARLAGLGRVSDAITNIINRIRQPIDRALDRVVDWLASIGRRFMGAVRSAAGRVVEWWRQRKPFRTSDGESHEVYFLGDERNPQPMVASHNPRPIAYRLDQFEQQARASGATPEEQAELNIIAATRTALARNPNDNLIVTNLQRLFNVFDAQTRPRVADYRPRTGTISGDPTGTTVGIGMRIDGLNAAFIRNHPGTPPQSSAQESLMNVLETDPSRRSPEKYIKGHLLNHNLGGIGNAENMFPITGNANSRHYYSVEQRVVSWVQANSRNWAIYEVDVVNMRADIMNARTQRRRNKVNATLQARATLKDGQNRDHGTIMSAITSEYQQRHDYERVEI